MKRLFERWAPKLTTGAGYVYLGATRHDAQFGGRISYGDPCNYMYCDGDGTVAWPLTVMESGLYDVYFNLASQQDGVKVSVSAGGKAVSGAFPASDAYHAIPARNFNRHSFDQRLYLTTGENTLRLSVTGNAGIQAVELCLQGRPLPWGKPLARGSEMEWFSRAGYGIMVHWTSASLPRKGPSRPYSLAVEQFDVEGFVRQVARTGASYALFTLNHADPCCPAPIPAWEALHPGWTAKRDLVMELATALEACGKRLMLYVNCDIYGRMWQCQTREEFLERILPPLRAIGERYGRHVAGYWFDTWFAAFDRFGDFPMEKVREAATAGHPGRICCFNSYIFPSVSRYQDFWSGEVVDIVRPADAPVMQWGPGKGLPYHMLLVMDDMGWVHDQQDTAIAPPRFSVGELGAYLKQTMAHGGTATVNMGIYQEGLMSGESVELLQKAGEIARG